LPNRKSTSENNIIYNNNNNIYNKNNNIKLPDPSLSGYGCNIKPKSLGPLLNAKSKSLGSEC
jgi:hypothetical protein